MMGPSGRLGNRIWAYANVLALATELRVRVVNPAFQEIRYFRHSAAKPVPLSEATIVTLAALLPHWLCKKLYSINLRVRALLCVDTGDSWMLDLEGEPRLQKYISPGGIVFLSGLFLSAHACMERQHKLLSQFFSLRDEYENSKTALVDRARQGADVLIGVHIRHGDYKTYCDGIMYYTAAEYAAVMNLLEQQLPSRTVRFLVCSDERQDASSFPGLKVTISDEIPVVDIYALSSCDYIVGPNSSFSQWSSFIGQVPLHVLDYKAAKSRHDVPPIYTPNLQRDFAAFNPHDFSRFSSRKVSIADYVRPTRWWHRY